ncbi:MAG: Hsp20/alpha crystallin family protein [Erysipelotrichia bacterium]|nr:Hsp20/alpha crystallin family protein [Erysipelotrichia bacterium]NCC54811.1 Hsp20/alpha crystallin family protein [Erysipelotrichia bacterium]
MKFLPGFSLLDSFDDFFNDSFDLSRNSDYMKTDVHEKDGNYIMDMELPGYKKEDIHLSLKDGYLNISAQTNNDREEKDDKGNIIRKERYSGSCSRSFFVGEHLVESDINAKFENGELTITIPKKEVKQVDENRFIPIQ